MIMSMSDILKKVSEAPTKKEKLDILHKHRHPGFEEFLALTLREDIKWLLPEGQIEYKPCVDQHDQKGMLYNVIRKMHMFIEAPNYRMEIDQKKRERLFVQILESVDSHDAELLLLAKDKKLPHGIKKSLIKEAYPELLRE